MRLSVDEIQARIGAVVDQDENTANISATDYSLRLKYINMSLQEWAETWDWPTLFGEYNARISTATGNASVALPGDFRRLAGFPKITWDGTTTNEFPEVLPTEDGQYGASDKRIWIIGSPEGGYIMRVFGVTLVSGASFTVPYYSSPQSLVSPANIADIPNQDFIVKRTVAYLWEAREDPRFPQMKAEAEKILRNMIEYENMFNKGSDYDRVKTDGETKYNFRIGRD